jgi:hypothetical protein
LLISALRAATSGTVAHTAAPPMLAHRHAYPCSRPSHTAGPASRSRLASRCQKGRCQRTDVRCHTAPGLKNAIPMTKLEMPEGKRRPSCRRRRLMPDPGAVCHLTSVI